MSTKGKWIWSEDARTWIEMHDAELPDHFDAFLENYQPSISLPMNIEEFSNLLTRICGSAHLGECKRECPLQEYCLRLGNLGVLPSVIDKVMAIAKDWAKKHPDDEDELNNQDDTD